MAKKRDNKGLDMRLLDSVTDPDMLKKMLIGATQGVKEMVAEIGILREYLRENMNLRLSMANCPEEDDCDGCQTECRKRMDRVIDIEQAYMRRYDWLRTIVPPKSKSKSEFADFEQQQTIRGLRDFCGALFELRVNTKDCMEWLSCTGDEDNCPNAERCGKVRELVVERIEMGAGKLSDLAEKTGITEFRP